MASTVTPTQTRINDPYQDTVFQFNTPDSKLYLSKESNKLLNVVGEDIVLSGLNVGAPTIVAPSTVRTVVTAGWAIQDSMLIHISGAATVDIDCSALTDTDVSGSHLGVFLRYRYLNTVELNPATVDIYHVDSLGTVYNPSGRFTTNSCRILLGIIEFTKSGSTVTAASLSEDDTLLVSGTNMIPRGDPDNVNISNIFSMAFDEDKEYLIKRDFLFME